MPTVSPRRAGLLQRQLPMTWRVAIAFAAMSMAITGLLAVVTWHLASSYLLSRREQGATTQAAVDAHLVQEVLRDPRRNGPVDLIQGLAGGGDVTVALRRQGTWTVSGPAQDVPALPAELLALAGSGTPPGSVSWPPDSRFSRSRCPSRVASTSRSRRSRVSTARSGS
ncbi:hypothetical protein ACFQV8_03770 [Pseudonocardia benzenivorans]